MRMHELTDNIDSENNVQTSDGEIYEAADEMMIYTWIQQKVTGDVSEFDVFLHGSVSKEGTEMTTVSEDVKRIFPLIEENSRRK